MMVIVLKAPPHACGVVLLSAAENPCRGFMWATKFKRVREMIWQQSKAPRRGRRGDRLDRADGSGLQLATCAKTRPDAGGFRRPDLCISLAIPGKALNPGDRGGFWLGFL